MKKAMLFFWWVVCISFSAIAQSEQPIIGTGSILHYQIIDETSATHALTLNVSSVDDSNIRIGWDIPDLGDGIFIMSVAALQTGTRGYWNQPYSHEDTRLDNDQTVACFSQQFYQQIINTGKAKYGGEEYIKKNSRQDQEFKIKGKPVDALFLISKDGHTKLWMLNDREVPLILKTENNPSGIDVILEDIN